MSDEAEGALRASAALPLHRTLPGVSPASRWRPDCFLANFVLQLVKTGEKKEKKNMLRSLIYGVKLTYFITGCKQRKIPADVSYLHLISKSQEIEKC